MQRKPYLTYLLVTQLLYTILLMAYSAYLLYLAFPAKRPDHISYPVRSLLTAAAIFATPTLVMAVGLFATLKSTRWGWWAITIGDFAMLALLVFSLIYGTMEDEWHWDLAALALFAAAIATLFLLLRGRGPLRQRSETSNCVV